MHSAMEAVKENLITPIFIGDKNEIQKCAEQLKWDISKYEIINEPVGGAHRNSEEIVLNTKTALLRNLKDFTPGEISKYCDDVVNVIDM